MTVCLRRCSAASNGPIADAWASELSIKTLTAGHLRPCCEPDIAVKKVSHTQHVLDETNQFLSPYLSPTTTPAGDVVPRHTLCAMPCLFPSFWRHTSRPHE